VKYFESVYRSMNEVISQILKLLIKGPSCYMTA